MLRSVFSQYAQGGMAMALGFDPHEGGHGRGPGSPAHQRGSVIFQGYNSYWGIGNGPQPLAQGTAKGWAKAGALGMSSGIAAFSVYNAYHGFQEDGLSGAKDAVVWDVATSAAVTRFAFGANGSAGPSAGYGLTGWRTRAAEVGIKPAGALLKFGGGGGTMMGITRSLGASVGAGVGQAVLGTPGAFIGAYVGAAPIRFAATHPLLAGGMVAGAAAAAVGYGTYSVIKGTYSAGYEHRQSQRGINTSGSMAAFMTTGANTMRQRAVQAIHKSHLNARSALGQEAGFMHMPSKNYHSAYR